MRISDWSSDVCSSDLDLAAVSLDGHLGTGITPGDKAAEYLAEHLDASPDAFDNLEFITPHSSRRDKARPMARRIIQTLEAHEALRDRKSVEVERDVSVR